MKHLQGPVFLFSSGGRTGSTLVQRLLLSTRHVMMWGEHGGKLLPALQELFRQIDAWNRDNFGYDMLSEYRKNPDNSWVANMNPDRLFFMSGCRALLDQSLGAPARELGFERWGFKEIRYGDAEALNLQNLFPRASFVFLVRHPESCLRSIKSTDWYAKDFNACPGSFLAEWARLGKALSDVQCNLQRACLLRYEDIIAQPSTAVERIAHTTGIPANAFDLSVLDKVLRGSKLAPASLEEVDMAALQLPEVKQTAAQLGYLLSS